MPRAILVFAAAMLFGLLAASCGARADPALPDARTGQSVATDATVAAELGELLAALDALDARLGALEQAALNLQGAVGDADELRSLIHKLSLLVQRVGLLEASSAGDVGPELAQLDPFGCVQQYQSQMHVIMIDYFRGAIPGCG